MVVLPWEYPVRDYLVALPWESVVKDYMVVSPWVPRESPVMGYLVVSL